MGLFVTPLLFYAISSAQLAMTVFAQSALIVSLDLDSFSFSQAIRAAGSGCTAG